MLGPRPFLALTLLGLAPLGAQQALVFNNGAEPETLDPALMTALPAHTLALALFEGLTTLDPITLEPRPGMASSWQVSEDGNTYTFQIREGSSWVDTSGRQLGPVTAHDFVYAWRRVVDPATASPYAYQLYPVRGARSLARGEETELASLGVMAPDARSLVVTLEAPCPYFLDLCAFPTLMPVHRSTVERHLARARREGNPELARRWAREGSLVSNGPFHLVKWSPRQHVRMERNPHYWNAAAVHLEEITALPLDAEAAYMRFLDGKVDWVRSVPLGRVAEVRLNPDYFVSGVLATEFYACNTTRPPLDDPRVRQALNLALDKEDLCRHVLQAGQLPARGFVPPGLPGYPPLEGPGHDPRRARELLQEAGYRTPDHPSGKAMRPLELLFNTSDQHKHLAEAVAHMWERTLGLTVLLRNSEFKVCLERRRSLDFDLIRRSWFGDYLDPNTFLDLFVTGGGNNNTGWEDAHYDELIARAGRELDPEARLALLREAERLLCTEALPVLPLYSYVNQGLVAEYVVGIEPNVRDLHPFQHIRIDEEILAELREE